MLIWLASYPRSGNTLLRTILNRCFGARSYSLYNTIETEKMADLVGHDSFHAAKDDFLAEARASDAPVFVKTHELPGDDDKAIYVVRDGRAAVASYRTYIRDYTGQEVPFEQLVLGLKPWGPWGAHALAWADRPEGTTLLLTYEETVRPDRALLDRIAAFVGLPVSQEFDLTFQDMRRSSWKFFSTGSNDRGIQAVDRQCPALFRLVNGEAMRRFGYGGPDFSRPDNAVIPLAIGEMRLAFDRLAKQVPRIDTTA